MKLHPFSVASEWWKQTLEEECREGTDRKLGMNQEGLYTHTCEGHDFLEWSEKRV